MLTRRTVTLRPVTPREFITGIALSVSSTVASPVTPTEPLIFDFVILTPVACTCRWQLISLASITLPTVVIVHGPEYGLSTVPTGTPVLCGPGQHPPIPSGPPGVCRVPTHAVGGGGGDGLVSVVVLATTLLI